MYVTQPPAPLTDGTRSAPLSVSRIVRRAFDSTSDAGLRPPTAPDSELHRFLADLLAPYGKAPNPNPLDQTYAGMAEALLRPSGLLDTSVDLVVLAHAVPDADPRRSAANLLNRLCAGDPLAFAISDQAVAAPFTAVATAREYLRTGGCGRALVLVLEQAALPYPAVQPVALPDRASAVALVLERSGTMPVVLVDQRSAVQPERVGAVLAEMTDAVPRSVVQPTVVVLGPGLAGHVEEVRHSVAPAAQVRVAPAGRLCTAVWWELADVLEDNVDEGQGVLVADYDPVSGGLCVLGLGPRISEPRISEPRISEPRISEPQVSGRPAATT